MKRDYQIGQKLWIVDASIISEPSAKAVEVVDVCDYYLTVSKGDKGICHYRKKDFGKLFFETEREAKEMTERIQLGKILHRAYENVEGGYQRDTMVIDHVAPDRITWEGDVPFQNICCSGRLVPSGDGGNIATLSELGNYLFLKEIDAIKVADRGNARLLAEYNDAFKTVRGKGLLLEMQGIVNNFEAIAKWMEASERSFKHARSLSVKLSRRVSSAVSIKYNGQDLPNGSLELALLAYNDRDFLGAMRNVSKSAEKYRKERGIKKPKASEKYRGVGLKV